MFGIPRPTPLDLHFSLFGVPVWVSAWHWVGTLLFGYQFTVPAGPLGGADLAAHLAIAAVCIFLSILLHEMGHALFGRLFGMEKSVLLLFLGGLAYGPHPRGVKWWQNVLFFLAGPGAQLLLAAFIFGGWVAAEAFAGGVQMNSALGKTALVTLLGVNIIWPIFNLLPIYPLDGGQIMRTLLGRFLRRDSELWTARVSLLFALMLGALALVGKETILAVFFGMFAYQNYQLMQALGRR